MTSRSLLLPVPHPASQAHERRPATAYYCLPHPARLTCVKQHLAQACVVALGGAARRLYRLDRYPGQLQGARGQPARADCGGWGAMEVEATADTNERIGPVLALHWGATGVRCQGHTGGEGGGDNKLFTEHPHGQAQLTRST